MLSSHSKRSLKLKDRIISTIIIQSDRFHVDDKEIRSQPIADDRMWMVHLRRPSGDEQVIVRDSVDCSLFPLVVDLLVRSPWSPLFGIIANLPFKILAATATPVLLACSGITDLLSTPSNIVVQVDV